ncbi:unnamed protein product, partial [Tilletia controversa]
TSAGTSGRAVQQGQRRAGKSISMRSGHWRRKYAKQIQQVQKGHDKNIEALAKIAGVEKLTVRRACRADQPHLKKGNEWNTYQRLVKKNKPADIKNAYQAHKAEASRVKEAAGIDVDAENLSTSGTSRTEEDAEDLPAAVDKETAVPLKQVKKDMRKIQKKLLNFIKYVEDDYSFTTFAIMAHPDSDLTPVSIGSHLANTVMDTVIKRMNPNESLDRVYTDFRIGVSWSHKKGSSGAPSSSSGSASAVPAAISVADDKSNKGAKATIYVLLARRLRAFCDTEIRRLVKDKRR